MMGNIDGDYVIDERGSKWRIIRKNESGDCAIQIEDMKPTGYTKTGGGLALAAKCALFSNGVITEVDEGEKFEDHEVRGIWQKS